MSPIVDGVIQVERTVTASAHQVWDAFTRPAAMAAWMWAGLGESPRAVSDARPGGRYRVAMDQPAGKDGWASSERAFEGVYAVVEPPDLLVYTLHWDAPVGYNQAGAAVPSEVVVVEIEGSPDSTFVRMRHMGIPDDATSLMAHERGIEAMLDGLERFLS